MSKPTIVTAVALLASLAAFGCSKMEEEKAPTGPTVTPPAAGTPGAASTENNVPTKSEELPPPPPPSGN